MPIPDFIDTIIQGDTLEVLKTFPNEFIDCIITSPPYWGLRDYGVEGQLGLEKTPEEYVNKLVEVFREVKRILKKEGTLWLNLGDSYNGSGGSGGDYMRDGLKEGQPKYPGRNIITLKSKDLVGIPWRVAFALQSDGWYLRQDIIWAKPNPMPESVTDRCTKSHEYIFLLAKSPKYYFDNEAIKEPHAEASIKRAKYGGTGVSTRTKEMTPPGTTQRWNVKELKYNFENGRNKRSVWTITTKPFKEAHFATFPEDLVRPMILAGCPEYVCKKCGKAREKIYEGRTQNAFSIRIRDNKKGIMDKKSGLGIKYFATEQEVNNYNENIYAGNGKKFIDLTDCGCNAGFTGGIVLDPFMGSGTTALVAKKLGRHYIGIELNPDYIEMANKRLNFEMLDFGEI